VDTLVDNLSQPKGKRFAEAQAYVETNLLVDTLANTLAEAESTTLGDTPGDMNADALVYHSRTATHMAHRTTLGDVEANTLISKLGDTFNCSKTETVRDIVDEAVVYTLVGMVLEREVERLCVTLDSCKTEAIIDLPPARLVISLVQWVAPGLHHPSSRRCTECPPGPFGAVCVTPVSWLAWPVGPLEAGPASVGPGKSI